ncbi:hypothetical protein CSUI_005157 [Cystoisospora suis]|uniref:Uncharacterized protein n=1 Tax=Cystoisospora suis TaxID=483139 RepID=A0A2C6KW73_9APIC|nr:hypothetical protein CSUI_005157 [Cystoisospora suis]
MSLTTGQHALLAGQRSQGLFQSECYGDGGGNGRRHARDEGILLARQNRVSDKSSRGQGDLGRPPSPCTKAAKDMALLGGAVGFSPFSGGAPMDGHKEREALLELIEDQIGVDENFYVFGGGPLAGAANRLEQLAAESQVEVFWESKNLGPRKPKQASQGGPGAEERKKPTFSSFASRAVQLGVQLDRSFAWQADLPEGLRVRHLSCGSHHMALLSEQGEIYIYKIRHYPWQNAGFDTWRPLASLPNKAFVHVEIRSLDLGDAALDAFFDYAAFQSRTDAPDDIRPAHHRTCASAVGPLTGEKKTRATSGCAFAANSGSLSTHGNLPATPANRGCRNCCCVSRNEDPTSLFALAAIDDDGNLWLGSNAYCCCKGRLSTSASVGVLTTSPLPSSSPNPSSSCFSSSNTDPFSSSLTSCTGSPRESADPLLLAQGAVSQPVSADWAALLPPGQNLDRTTAVGSHLRGCGQIGHVPSSSETAAHRGGAVEDGCGDGPRGTSTNEDERGSEQVDVTTDGACVPLLVCRCSESWNEDRSSDTDNVRSQETRKRESGEDASRSSPPDGEEDGSNISGRVFSQDGLRYLQHCPMRPEALKIPVSQDSAGIEERGRCLFVSLAEIVPVFPSREYPFPACSLPLHPQARSPQPNDDTPALSACPPRRSASGEKLDTVSKQRRGSNQGCEVSSAERDSLESPSESCESVVSGVTEERGHTEKSREAEKREKTGPSNLVQPDTGGNLSSGLSPPSSSFSASSAWFPFFPPLRYAVIAQSRLYNKRHGLIIRGRNLNCRAAPLPHPPAKVRRMPRGYDTEADESREVGVVSLVCGTDGDCGVLLFQNGVAYQWRARALENGKVVPGLSRVEGSLKDKRVVDVFGGCNGTMVSEARGSGSGDFFFVDQHSVIHELNFALGVGSPAGGSGLSASSGVLLTSRRRPPIPEPIECTPFCFDLLYSHPSSDVRIPYRPENFLRLLSSLPRSHLLFLLSLPCVPQDVLTGEYLFLSPADRLCPSPNSFPSLRAARPRPYPPLQAHVSRASSGEKLTDGSKNQLTGTGCSAGGAGGANHVVPSSHSASSRGVAGVPQSPVVLCRSLSPSFAKSENRSPTNPPPSSCLSADSGVPSGDSPVPDNVPGPSPSPARPSTLSSSRSLQVAPPPSSTSPNAAFLARCLEHFQRLRQLEVHLLYRCVRRPYMKCLSAVSQRAEEETCCVQCSREGGIRVYSDATAQVGLNGSPAPAADSPAVSPPSAFTPPRVSPSPAETASSALSPSVPARPSSSGPSLPCTAQSYACVCSASTSKSPGPKGDREDSIVSLQAVGDFLLLIWKTGRIEGLRKCFVGLKSWKRGQHGGVCITGRTTESAAGVTRWHLQELLRVHCAMNLGTYRSTSLSALVVDRLPLSCSASRASGLPQAIPASSFNPGHLSVPSKPNQQGDSLGPSPLSADEEIVSRHPRISPLKTIVANSPLFRLFCSAGYVVLCHYQLSACGEVADSSFASAEPGALSKIVVVPPSSSKGKVLSVAEEGRRANECGASLPPSSPRGSSAELPANGAAAEDREEIERGTPSVRGCPRMTSGDSSSTSVPAEKDDPTGLVRTPHEGTRSPSQSPHHEDGFHLPLPLQLVSADLWRTVAAAASENSRLFLRLSELQRTLITYGEKKLKRYLIWLPPSGSSKRSFSDTRSRYFPFLPVARKVRKISGSEGESKTEKRASKEDTVETMLSRQLPSEHDSLEDRVATSTSLPVEGDPGHDSICLKKAISQFVEDIADRFALMYVQQVFPLEEVAEGEVVEQGRKRDRRGGCCIGRARTGDSAGSNTREFTGDHKKPRVFPVKSLGQHSSKKNSITDEEASATGRPAKIGGRAPHPCKTGVEPSGLVSPAPLLSVVRETKNHKLAYSRGRKGISAASTRLDSSAISLRCKQSSGALRTHTLNTRATAGFLRGVNQDRSRSALSRSLKGGGGAEREENSRKRATKKRRRLLRAKLERLRQRAVTVYEKPTNEAEKERSKSEKRAGVTPQEQEGADKAVVGAPDDEETHLEDRDEANGAGAEGTVPEKSEENVEAEKEKIEGALEVAAEGVGLSQPQVIEERERLFGLDQLAAAADCS